jgi:predicted transcriptional regulator
MADKTGEIIEELAKELRYSEDLIVKESLKAFLERQLRQVKAEILQISGKYQLASAEEMEARYRKGTLEEEETWRDLQQLDHLEYKRDRLIELLGKLE